ncbi:tetratricopeptide repeat protein, partial [Pseudomonas sp. SG-MS2]
MPKPQRARTPNPRHTQAPVDLAQARRHCQRRPDDASAWQTLGNLQLAMEPEQALASFEQALQLLPHD